MKTRLARDLTAARPRQGRRDAHADRRRDQDGARRPPRPGARHLPAAPGGQGSRCGARRPGAAIARPDHDPSRGPRPLRPRGGGGGLLLVPRGPPERRQVRGGELGHGDPRAVERAPDVRGRGRRPWVRPRVPTRAGPGCRGSPTGWGRSTAISPSAPNPARARGSGAGSRSGREDRVPGRRRGVRGPRVRVQRPVRDRFVPRRGTGHPSRPQSLRARGLRRDPRCGSARGRRPTRTHDRGRSRAWRSRPWAR